MRCTLFSDEVDYSTNDWYSICYALCFAHDIVTSTVSAPAPVYCAHNLAKRGKANFRAAK